MSFDSRFPHLARLDEASLPVRVKAFGEAVAARIFGSVCYNRATDALHWYYGEPDRSPFALDATEAGTVGGMTADQAVAYIQRGKMSRTEKDRIMERAERDEKHESKRQRKRQIEDRRPDLTRFLEHRDRARRGVQKVFG